MKPADALFDYAISQFLAWYAHAGRPNPSFVAPRAAWARPAGLRDRATHPDLNRFIARQAEA